MRAFLKFADLYCGAGFGARGVVNAGGVPVIAVDAWDRAADTYKQNFPHTTVFNSRVEELDPHVLAKESAIDLLLASPECTSHSVARGARPGCERSKETALHILPWIDAFKPRWVIIENVSRMAAWTRHSEVVEGIQLAGYQVQPVLVNAAHLGVPQSRIRLFLLCDREDMPPSQQQITAIVSKSRTAAEILDTDGTWPDKPLYLPGRAKNTLERAERAIAALGEGVPFLIVYYGTDHSGGWQPLTVPLRTITTLDRFALVTWKGEEPRMRMLQPQELVRAMVGLGSFHDVSIGSRRDRIRLCGNGVCSPVLERIIQIMCIDATAMPAPNLLTNIDIPEAVEDIAEAV